MTIARKPKATTPENFIEQGGSAAIRPESEAIAPSVDLRVPQEKTISQRGRPKKEKVSEIGVKLRIEASLLEQIDADVNSRQPSPSRHQWILEAIYEKLDRQSHR